MTFSGELLVWLVFCCLGGLTSFLSLSLANLILTGLRRRRAAEDAIGWARHLCHSHFLRVLFWGGGISVGVLATFQEPLPQTVGSVSEIGALIRWMLIGTVVLLSIETANDFLFTWRKWRQSNP